MKKYLILLPLLLAPLAMAQIYNPPISTATPPGSCTTGFLPIWLTSTGLDTCVAGVPTPISSGGSITLTTNGTGGASTYSSGTLNIPVYASGLNNAASISADPNPAACPGNYIANSSSAFNVTLPSSPATGCIVNMPNSGTATATIQVQSSGTFTCVSGTTNSSATTCAVAANQTATAKWNGTIWTVTVMPTGSSGSGGAGAIWVMTTGAGGWSMTASSTYYSAPTGTASQAAAWTTTEAYVMTILPAACTVKNLHITGYVNQSSTGATTVTVRRCPGGTSCASTSITANIPASTSCSSTSLCQYSDTTHSQAFSAGDGIDVQIQNGATATQVPVNWSLQCD